MDSPSREAAGDPPMPARAPSSAVPAQDWVPLRRYLAELGTRRVLALLCLGLGLRLLLAPLAMHPDLASVYDRVRLVRIEAFDLYDYSFQALPIALHWIYAQALSLALPDLTAVHWPDPSEQEIFNALARMFEQPDWLPLLLLWKLPYVLADLLAGLLLARLVPSARALPVLALWMLHPLALYATGLFGKYESFMLVPLLWGFLELRQNHPERAFLAFGVASAMRIYPFLLLVPVALALGSSWRRRAELLVLCSLPLLILLGACVLRSGWALVGLPALALSLAWVYARLRGTGTEVALLASSAVGLLLAAPSLGELLFREEYTVANLLHHAAFLQLSNASNAGISWFGLIYGVLLLWCVQRSAQPLSAAARNELGLDAALLAGLCFFGLAFFHPQYSALLAALVLLRLHRIPSGMLAHAAQIVGVLLMLTAFSGGNASLRLFLPLAPKSTMLLPGPLELLPADLGSLPWAQLGHTLLALGSAWMAFELLRGSAAERALALGRPGRWAFAIGLGAWPMALGLLLWCAAHSSLSVQRPAGQALEQDGSWNASIPSNAIRLGVAQSLPSGLLIAPRSASKALDAGYRLFVSEELADGSRRRVGDYSLSRAELYAGELAPGTPGALRVPLENLGLEPGRNYQFQLQREVETSAAQGASVQPLERVPLADLLHEASGEMQTRWQQLAGGGLPVSAAEPPTPLSALEGQEPFDDSASGDEPGELLDSRLAVASSRVPWAWLWLCGVSACLLLGLAGLRR